MRLALTLMPTTDLNTFVCISNEDDITVVLSDIAMANTVIKAGLAKGTNTQTMMV